MEKELNSDNIIRFFDREQAEGFVKIIDEAIEHFVTMRKEASDLFEQWGEGKEWLEKIEKEGNTCKVVNEREVYVGDPDATAFLLGILLDFLQLLSSHETEKEEEGSDIQKKINSLLISVGDSLSIVRVIQGIPDQDGSRRFYPIIEKTMKSAIGGKFIFEKDAPSEFSSEECEAPKEGEHWTVLDYIVAPVDAEWPVEDKIVFEKDGCKISLPSRVAFFIGDMEENQL